MQVLSLEESRTSHYLREMLFLTFMNRLSTFSRITPCGIIPVPKTKISSSESWSQADTFTSPGIICCLRFFDPVLMKTKGKCLVCATKLPEEEIPPERTKMYRHLTQSFIRCLSSKGLSEAGGTSSADGYGEIFPFCIICQNGAIKLYRKYSQLQSGLARIRQVMATKRGQRILCEMELRKYELFLQSDELDFAGHSCADVTSTDEELTDSEDKQEDDDRAEKAAVCDDGEILNSPDISLDALSQDHLEKELIHVIALRTNKNTYGGPYSNPKSGFQGDVTELEDATGFQVHSLNVRSDSEVIVEEAPDANDSDSNESSTALEDCREDCSDSNDSPAHERDSDCSYEVSSDSSDEDSTASVPAAPRNRIRKQETCEAESRLIPPSIASRKSNLVKSDQNDNSSHCKQVLARHPLRKTGPKTYTYMGFNLENVETGYRCCACGHEKDRRHKIMRHIRSAHVSGSGNPTIRMIEKSPNKWYYAEFMAEKFGDIFYCAACHYTHKDRVTMREHLRYRHYVIAHPERGPPKSFVCETCGKVISRVSMYQHLESHMDEPKFTCKDCGERFKTRNRFYHHRKIHVGEQGKKFMCEHCGRKFYTQYHLRNHMFQHTGNREFICKTCGKSYGSDVALQIHFNTHKGKKYSCDICGMEFTQSYSVTRHKGTAHGIYVVSAKRKGAIE